MNPYKLFKMEASLQFLEWHLHGPLDPDQWRTRKKDLENQHNVHHSDASHL